MYGGSYDTIRPSFEYGGTQGKWNYFMDGSYDHNDLGIENPTPSHERHSRHDGPIQGVRLCVAHFERHQPRQLMGSASYSDFQVPNTPGLPAGNRAGRQHAVEYSRQRTAGKFQFREPERKSKRAELLRRGDLPKIGGRFESIKPPFLAATAACISRPIRSAICTSTAWPATWNAISIRRLAGRRQLRPRRQAHDSAAA